MPANPDMLLQGKSVEVLTKAAPKLIYGTIVLAAVVGPLRSPLPHSIVIIALCFFSMLGIMIAGAYADIIRHDMVEQEITPWKIKWGMLHKQNWVMASTMVPVICFGMEMLGLIKPEAALAATKALLLVVLLFFGFLARRLCGGGWLRSIYSGLIITLLGFTVIQIKVWVKYLPDISL